MPSDTGLPITRSDITDVAAWLIEQPTLSCVTPLTVSPSSSTRSVTSSPQDGFTWCTSTSYGSARPAWCGAR